MRDKPLKLMCVSASGMHGVSDPLLTPYYLQALIMTISRLKLSMLSASLLVISACGFFTQDDLDVEYTEDFSVTLPAIDSAALCPAGQDCTSAAQPVQMDRPLTPIELDVEIDIVEKTGRSELADYAGKFKSVNITKIEYAVKDNTLTFDIPEAGVFLAPAGVKTTTDPGAIRMATIPETIAMTSVDAGLAEINEANAAQLSALIQSLQVTALVQAEPVVKMGQPFPPSGKATLSLTVYVTFTANPADALIR